VDEEKGTEDTTGPAPYTPDPPTAINSPMFDKAEDTTIPVTVPDDDCARLMYYLNCKHYFPEISKHVEQIDNSIL